MERIKTGISELDEIIGGFPEGKTIIITGDPGSGKTIFGLQFAYANCLEGKKILYVSTEEDAPELKQQGRSFGWNFESFENRGFLKFVELAGYRAMEIKEALSISMEAVKGDFTQFSDNLPVDTNILIIDSLGSHVSNLTSYEFRDRFNLLVYNMAQKGITTVVLLGGVISREFVDLALYSAYGAIQLLKRENPYTGLRERVMDIVKMRNTKTPVQLLPYEISSTGIIITIPIDSSG
ncbi:MAG: AAA family ATPase [Candidatus Methanoperedens sp.]|nr:AAA family ATPase [Candidatus Methanoperedens sp.]CAG0983650.1 Circadian clock protein kinase KaiC [Methanosarcinales archaeon]